MGNGLDKINALIATRVQLRTNLLPRSLFPRSPLPKSNRLSVYSASPKLDFDSLFIFDPSTGEAVYP